MHHLKTTLAVIGAAVVLVLAGNTIALAANGSGFLLGKSNSATKISILKRTTPGTALKVSTKSAANAPFLVNGHGKVANLNADKVDGFDSGALLNKVIRYRLPASTGAQTYTWNLPGLPSGTYLATYTVYGSGAGTGGQCWFLKPSSSVYKVVSNAALTSGTLTYNGTGVFKTSEVTQFHCFSSATLSIDTSVGGPTEVTFTRINALSDPAATFRQSPSNRTAGR